LAQRIVNRCAGRVVFWSSRKGPIDLYRKASNGSGSEELLYADNLNKLPTSWSPDGKSLLYYALDPKTGQDLWILPNPLGPPGAPKPYPFLRTQFNETYGQFSPDGKWIAYESDESGQYEIYAAPFPGPGGKRQIPTGGGQRTRWRRDGREIFYIAPDNRLMAVDIAPKGDTLETGEPRALFGPVQNNGYQYDVRRMAGVFWSTGGRRFHPAHPPPEVTRITFPILSVICQAELNPPYAAPCRRKTRPRRDSFAD
jgi:hypothetical protein